MEFPFLAYEWMATPLWMWFAFLLLVATLLVFDLGVLNRKDHEIGVRESLLLSAFYIGLGLAFGGAVWALRGAEDGVNYLTGFVVEKSLAMDNVFVIGAIFTFFSVPRIYQHRVLFWGILGVIVLRALMIGAGAALVTNFAWALNIFAVFLIFTGLRMLVMRTHDRPLAENALIIFLNRRLPVTNEHHARHFFVRLQDPATGRMKWYVTPLFMALVTIEFADVIFAVDSVPAIFGITTDAFIVYTSNIFAILGLRALYFALAALVHRFEYLKPALALVLIFIGVKIFAADLLGIEKVPPAVSLGVTFALLASGVAYSLWRTRGRKTQMPAPESR